MRAAHRCNRRRPRATRSLQDRLVWQCASLLLAYPDEHFAERLGIVDELPRSPSPGARRRCWHARSRRCAHATRCTPRPTTSRSSTCDAAMHAVPDLVDRRRHPPPRPGVHGLRHRPTATPGVDWPPRRAARLPAGGARVRRDRRPRRRAAAAVEHRAPIELLRLALTECGHAATPARCRRCARRCRRATGPDVRRRSGWRRPARPRKRLAWNRSR